jgi:hypothetical protein
MDLEYMLLSGCPGNVRLEGIEGFVILITEGLSLNLFSL